MWKTLSDWLLALFNMSRELQEHRETIRGLEDRLRNTEEGLSMLRDLVHAEISFKELAQQTGLGEKALHRMLSPHVAVGAHS